MTTISHLFLFISGIVFFIAIILLLLKNKISEKYSIVWLSAGIIILIISSEPRLLDYAANLIGISYPPSLLFLLSILVLLGLNLYFSIELSKIHQKLRVVTQTISLNEMEEAKLSSQDNEIEELKKTLSELAVALEEKNPINSD